MNMKKAPLPTHGTVKGYDGRWASDKPYVHGGVGVVDNEHGLIVKFSRKKSERAAKERLKHLARSERRPHVRDETIFLFVSETLLQIVEQAGTACNLDAPIDAFRVIEGERFYVFEYGVEEAAEQRSKWNHQLAVGCWVWAKAQVDSKVANLEAPHLGLEVARKTVQEVGKEVASPRETAELFKQLSVLRRTARREMKKVLSE